MNEIVIAVVGQPNAGKSTLFNMLTGARQFIANYPGVTVEKKTGIYYYLDDKYILVDLPGTYSLTSYSLEEKVARNYLLHERPDLVLNIIDASNIERHLNLTLQLIELGLPLVVVLNMMDTAKDKGLDIDIKKLEQILGFPVVPSIAKKNKGKEEIKKALRDAYYTDSANLSYTKAKVDYGKDLEETISFLTNRLQEYAESFRCNPRWLAVKLLSGDPHVESLLQGGELE